MTEGTPKALLPAGLRDVLPPEAEHEAALVEALLAVFAGHGYERVKPPLVEFEDTLTAGEAAPEADQAFRMMDPISQRMLALRTDLTLQVARIATTRLVNAPRPVRLCYSGEVLRVKGTQLSPERQFRQAGVELIGAAQAAAGDAEVVLLAAEALSTVGVAALSIDLNLPTLVPALADALGMDRDTQARLRAALDRKDAAATATIEKNAGSNDLFGRLLAAAGPAEKTLAALDGLDLPDAAASEAKILTEVVTLVLAARPDTRLTVDPVENRGFEYHTGVAFTIFADGVRGELGSGGRYLATADGADDGEPATGFTLFTNVLLRAVPGPAPRPRVFVPVEASSEHAAQLRAEGWITVRGLTPVDDNDTEARRLRCTHICADGQARPLG